MIEIGIREVHAAREMVTPERFREGMRHLASAVSLITAAVDSVSYGLTATAVCSLSAEPPSLLVCVNRCAATHAAIARSGAFAVNVLSAEDVSLARLFSSSRPEERAMRFADSAWEDSGNGSPVLRRAAVAFDCRLDLCVEYASHSIFVGRILDVLAGTPGTSLIYSHGQYNSLRL